MPFKLKLADFIFCTLGSNGLTEFYWLKFRKEILDFDTHYFDL